MNVKNIVKKTNYAEKGTLIVLLENIVRQFEHGRKMLHSLVISSRSSDSNANWKAAAIGSHVLTNQSGSPRHSNRKECTKRWRRRPRANLKQP